MYVHEMMTANIHINEYSDISISTAVPMCVHIGSVTVFFNEDQQGIDQARRAVEVIQTVIDAQVNKNQIPDELPNEAHAGDLAEK